MTLSISKYSENNETATKAFLLGKNVALRGLQKEDCKQYLHKWMDDQEITHFLFMGAIPTSQESLEDWYEAIRQSDQDILFMIIATEEDKVIGFCGFHEIRWLHRSAEYRIFIGEKDFWSRGYGSECHRLMVRYGFELLNLNRIWLGVNASHARAVTSYKGNGFVEEGVLREETFRNSQYYDVLRMAILRNEYYSQFKKNWDLEIPNPFERKP